MREFNGWLTTVMVVVLNRQRDILWTAYFKILISPGDLLEPSYPEKGVTSFVMMILVPEASH